MEGNGRSMPMLIIESGPQAGVSFPLYKPLMTVGRLEENDIAINDEMVSRHHARIIGQGSSFLIEDLGSSNDTIVNGQRVSSHVLSDGDVIYLGQTTLTFWSMLAVQTEAVRTEIRAAPAKKKIMIECGIMGAAVLLGGMAVALIFLLGAEKAHIKPDIAITSPQNNQEISLKLPVNSSNDVPVNITASDDKGLDRVEILVNNKVEKTFKATKATKSAEVTGKLKQEDFTFNWMVTTEGDYTISARALDWKGYTGDSDPVVVKAKEGQDIMIRRDYVAKIDGLITEFVTYRHKFSRAYQGAKNEKISYIEAGYVFNEVGNQRRELLGRLNSIPPPPPFAGAHNLFAQQISYAIQADYFDVFWARDIAEWEAYRYYYDEEPDPNGYEKKTQATSVSCQKAALVFSPEYNARRADQLNAGPGLGPNA